MIIVANDFSATNWTQTIADAVDWIFKESDKMNRPCVINISAGTYLGSHDGIDLPAQYIDSIMNAQPGRIVVGAAGNAGGVPGFHLHAKVNGDTSFTWFKVNPSTGFGGPAVFAELWADSAQFNQITFSIGATDTSTWTDTTFVYANIKQRLDTLITTPLGGGTQLMTWAERQADVYLLQFLITQPNASNYYKFGITGTGEYDCWSAAWLGMSDMVRSKLPSSTAYPNIKNYKLPDSLQSVVSSWNCHPNIVSVANYNNRLEYENVDGGMRQTVNFPVLGIAATSSRGPNRRGVLKPDLAAPGNFTLTSGRLVDVNYLANTPSQRFKLAKGGYHFTNGGTSMAAPVVSGIAALLLEKCPNMNAVEIRQALYNTTFSDSFATTLPNVRWGRGKVDAQAALEFTHSYDSIQSSKTNFAFCEGDSLSLTLFNLNHNISYWLHGDTGVQIVKVDSSKYLTDWKAYFTNIEGCKCYTEIQKTTMNALPQFNIEGDTIFCLEEGDSLFATSPDSTLKWLWSGGDTTSFLPISVSGTYSLVATTPMGCSDSTTHFTQGILCYAGLEDVKSQSIKVYPNPSKGNLTIDLDGEWECLRIFDARGKMVWSSTTPLNKILKIPVLQPGVYSLTSGNWVQKIVIYD
jgi:subtilisin family serine protease